MRILEKNNELFVEEISFKKICETLDNRKKSFEESWRKWITPEKLWINLINRDNTFLTSK